MGKLKCGECNSKKIALKNVRGMAFAYKAYPSVVLDADCELNVCENCGNIIYYSEDYDLLNNAIEASIKKNAKTLIEELMLLNKMNQKELAKELGLSEVYLSNVKNCKIVLDYKTYNLLETKLKLAVMIRNSKQYISNYLYGRAHSKERTTVPAGDSKPLMGALHSGSYSTTKAKASLPEAAESNDYAYAMAA